MLMAALGPIPGQTGDLELNNVRATYGLLGAPRPDNKILPGDVYYVAFDIDNVKVDDTGKVLYSMGMEVLDSRNKTQFKQDPRDLEGFNSLGGGHLPAFANVDIGLDQPPGEYNLRVTVSDRTSKKTKSFQQKFEVLPRQFGLVRVRLTGDAAGTVDSANFGVAGQTLWLQCFGVGFERGGAKKEPDVALEMQVLDEAGNPVAPKPKTGEVKELPKDTTVFPIGPEPLALNRAGKFTIKLKATDRIGKKSFERSFPLTVVEAKS
jgi:hypothetical protein